MNVNKLTASTWRNCNYIGSMATQIVIGPLRIFHVLFAMRCGERDANDAPSISCCEPSFLIIIRAIKLPSFLLKWTKMIERWVKSKHKWWLMTARWDKKSDLGFFLRSSKVAQLARCLMNEVNDKIKLFWVVRLSPEISRIYYKVFANSTLSLQFDFDFWR